MFLSDISIRRDVYNGLINIEPFINDYVQPGSYDVHLGNHIKKSIPVIGGLADPLASNDHLFEDVQLVDGACVIRPGDFFIAHTSEIIGAGVKRAAIFNGKSSLGRLGLTVHQTAGWIDPGFRGVVVLELHNVSRNAIVLRAGMPIGQVLFVEMSTPVQVPYGTVRGSKYNGQLGAQLQIGDNSKGAR